MNKYSEQENIHISIMKEIVNNFYDLPIVLKGGTSLLLNFNLDRFSEDLDFDANKKLNLISRLKAVLNQITDRYSYKIVKDTDTVQRIRVNYIKNHLERSLKIEISFRNSFDESNTITKTDDDNLKVKTYRIEHLIEQKISALIGRTKARDLYDVNFLLNNYLADFSTDAKQKLKTEILSDIDAIREEYRVLFQDDYLFSEDALNEIISNLKHKKKALSV